MNRGIVTKMLFAAVMLACTLPLFAADKEEKVDDRIRESADVMKEILGMPEKGIPRDLLNRAECVIVYPSVKKAAFIVGGSYGRGLITCRRGADFSGHWSAPAMFALEGGSFGFQIGAQATDFVLLVMNESGAKSVLSSKVKLGTDASAAAGPVGRDTSAETDVVMKAEILSYSRAQGLFAGVSLEGSTMRSDDGANKTLYGRELSARSIVREGKVKAPAASAKLLAVLEKTSPHHVK
ncbi:MAG TPA: lipid-binding SYLF domain-containing protein [Dongiaceae bacterium]|nr:lipid-binding SYLF domain-containing protein [Dongiaceae bacterium]